jgi:hypothetical protein
MRKAGIIIAAMPGRGRIARKYYAQTCTDAIVGRDKYPEAELWPVGLREGIEPLGNGEEDMNP